MTTPYRILIGNEKGGTGKSTLAMNIIVSMLKDGLKVASIDLDGRQGTLTSYIKNRMNFIKNHNLKLAAPLHVSISLGDIIDNNAAKKDKSHFLHTLKELEKKADYIVIDTPGSHNHLLPIIHSHTDLIITPMNDSLIDLDVIAKINPDSMQIVSSSNYAKTVWNARQERAKMGLAPLSWFVIRNRLNSLQSNNQKQIDYLMDKLSKRIGFKIIEGMRERVVYRELFLKGLTVMDLKADDKVPLSVSHISARQEVRNLVDNIIQSRR